MMNFINAGVGDPIVHYIEQKCTDEISISDVNSHKTSLANIICA